MPDTYTMSASIVTSRQEQKAQNLINRIDPDKVRCHAFRDGHEVYFNKDECPKALGDGCSTPCCDTVERYLEEGDENG